MADVTQQVVSLVEGDINRDAKNVPRLIEDVQRHLALGNIAGSVDEKAVAQAAAKALVKKGLLKDIEVEEIGIISDELVFKSKRNDYAVLGQDGKQRKMFVLPISEALEPTKRLGDKTELDYPDGSIVVKEKGIVTNAGISSDALDMKRTFHRDAAGNVDQVTYEKAFGSKDATQDRYTEHWHREGANTWVEDQGNAPDKRRAQSVDVDDYGNMRVTRNGMTYLSIPSGREIQCDQTGNPLSNCIDLGADGRACLPSMPQSSWILDLDKTSYGQVEAGVEAIASDATSRSAKSMADSVAALKNLKMQNPNLYAKLEDSMSAGVDFPRLAQLRTEVAFRKSSGEAYIDGSGEIAKTSKRVSSDNLDLGALALEQLLVAKKLTQETTDETRVRTGQTINGTVVKPAEANDLKQTAAEIDAKIALLEKPHDIKSALQKLSNLKSSELVDFEVLLSARVINFETNSDVNWFNRELARHVEAKLARDALLYTMAAALHNKKEDPLLALTANQFYKRAKDLEPNNADFLQLDQILKHGTGTRV